MTNSIHKLQYPGLHYPALSNSVPKSEENINKRESVQEKMPGIAPGLGILSDLAFEERT